MKYIFFIVILLLVLIGCNGDDNDQRSPVFLLFGQSNMSGGGILSDLPPDFPANKDKIRIFGNDWELHPAYEPEDDWRGQIDKVSMDVGAGVGPGVSFADEMIRLGALESVIIVPCAKGGSSADMWLPTRDIDNRKTLYGSCLSRAREASWRGDIAGVLFYQGEADAVSTELAEDWPRKFGIIVDALREDLDAPELPIVFVQVGPLTPWRGPEFPGWQRLQEVQKDIRLPAVSMVEAWDLPTNLDGIHLSTSAQLELGTRMASAMASLL